ncbi:MAG: hypothetical protein ACJAUP_001760 [Cellvibrionaceae bacterium]|jgi:hypothetical protein
MKINQGKAMLAEGGLSLKKRPHRATEADRITATQLQPSSATARTPTHPANVAPVNAHASNRTDRPSATTYNAFFSELATNNTTKPKKPVVYRKSGMQEIANSTLATKAKIENAIVSGTLKTGETYPLKTIGNYGKNLNNSEVHSVRHSLEARKLITIDKDGDWKVTASASQIITASPELNWEQQHFDQIARINQASLPRCLEEYTALNSLKDININENFPITGKDFKETMESLGVSYSNDQKRALMKWLVTGEYIEKLNNNGDYMGTPAGCEKARAAIDDFTRANMEVVDRVQGQADASEFSGRGSQASSSTRRRRLNEIEHRYHSSILQKIIEGARKPGDNFSVTVAAAKIFNMTQKDLLEMATTLTEWGILSKKKLGPVKVEFKIHDNALTVITQNPELVWRAHNAKRLEKGIDDKATPGNWVHQALLEIISDGTIKNNQILPSKTSVRQAFKAKGLASVSNAFNWLQKVGIIQPQSQTDINKGYRVSPNGEELAKTILGHFERLDNDRPLEATPSVYTDPLHSRADAPVTFTPELPKKQERVAVFAHLLAQVVKSELSGSTGFPTTKHAVSQLGLPSVTVMPAHFNTLVKDKIIAPRATGEYQKNAHRDTATLLPDATRNIKKSLYLNWLAKNALGLSTSLSDIPLLNEADQAVLEMVAGRKYTRGNTLIGPRELQALAPVRQSKNAQYCYDSIHKYAKSGLLNMNGPKHKLIYTRLPGAQVRAIAVLDHFAQARQAFESGQPVTAANSANNAGQPSSARGNQVPPSSVGQAASTPLSPRHKPAADSRPAASAYDLEAGIAASNKLNRAQLSPNQIQQNNLPSGCYWHNPSSDGNCLFHALARRFPDLGSHQKIRTLVATAAESNEHMDPQFRQEFVAAVRQTGEYTGVAETAIQVAAEAFDIRISAIIEDGSLREFGPQNSERDMTLARSQDHFFLMEPIPQVNMADVFDDDISSSGSISAQRVQLRRIAQVGMEGVFTIESSSDSEASTNQNQPTTKKRRT